MCTGVTPQNSHVFYLPRHRLSFEAEWRPEVPHRRRAMTALRRALLGGQPDWAPEQAIDPDAFSNALKILDTQDVGRAVHAFTDLGYDVTVRAGGASHG